jgi:hypothetical protein
VWQQWSSLGRVLWLLLPLLLLLLLLLPLQCCRGSLLRLHQPQGSLCISVRAIAELSNAL